MVVVTQGRELSENQKLIFNKIWGSARNKSEDIFSRKDLRPQDLYFFLHTEDTCVAVGRLREIPDVYLEKELWKIPVWGMSSISVDPKYQKSGLGKKLVEEIKNYAVKNKLCIIGFYDKKSSLDWFYRKCGFEVNDQMGKSFLIKTGDEIKDNCDEAVLYFKNDPLIAEIFKNKKVYIPYTW
ncbi:protein containing GCN5-related N-acetyltransferase domain [sediment metagenome]|uniref:Protein containing GCN5-related N-acetyltransferase domain n=1 Tax=sediment metagenome TaxID=749907 RepID=D9PJT4_9ZZZZ